MTSSRLPLHGAWARSIGGVHVDVVSVPGGYRPVGQCTLTREFSLPPDFVRGSARYFLCTEGVLARAEFALNGEVLGVAGPFVPYRFEVPAALLRETDTVSATVFDIGETFGPTPGRRFDGGLIREVYLERRPAAFIASVRFQYELNEDLSGAKCRVVAELEGAAAGGGLERSGEATGKVLRPSELHVGPQDDSKGAPAARGVTVALVDEAGREVWDGTSPTEEMEFELSRPLLWSPERPHLYTLVVRLGEDGVREQVGFRRIEIRRQDFFLNGERLLLKGVCRHEFTGQSGYSPSEEEVRRDLARIKHAGFNYVRLVHSPQSAAAPRIASELGLLVSEEPGACFHDLSDEAVAGPALESLRRMVKRDRNCPSVLAWLIYNECLPDISYAQRAAAICRELDPGRFVSMADCSGRHEAVKAMVKAAGLEYYGINRYSFQAGDYVELMSVYHERPLVFTEWGGWWTQSNRGVVKALGDTFVRHAQEEASPRVAGCSFWVWQDYEEHSRPEPWSVEGVTIEGLNDLRGRPKQDLHWLSEWCFAMDHPERPTTSPIEVLLPGRVRPEEWQSVYLPEVDDQSALEAAVRHAGRFAFIPLWCERLAVAGIDFACRDFTRPLLIGRGQEEVVIPVGRRVRKIAVLGHVALNGGYPSSGVFSVHHRDQEPGKRLGEPASAYTFVFDDGGETVPLRHGVHVLRSNDICRWWKTSPCASGTVPAVRAVLDPSFEILRYDLWEHDLGAPRFLEEMRWRLEDVESVQAMLAMSVAE